MHDFLHSMDKTKTGVLPSANFLKVMRVFGIPAPSVSVVQAHTNSIGMVSYEEVVEELTN